MKKLVSLFLISGVLAGFLSACSSEEKADLGYSRAQQTFDELYQRGKSERIQGNSDECLKTFNKIIELRKTIQDGLYAYSLYQSGLCYEMKNQNDRAIAVYQDALRVKSIVNSELSELEIPSRLAVAYSRIGENEVAEKYYAQAKKYIEQLKISRKPFTTKKEYYAEVLFQMGTIASQYKLNQGGNQDFQSYLKSVGYSQEYLMLVLEMNVAPYSEYAFKQMITNFQNTFNIIKNIPMEDLKDTVVAKRYRQQKQKEMSEMLAHHIDEFETAAVVQKKSTRGDYKEIFAKLKEIKSGLDSLINERPEGEGLTPEAKKLQNPKKEGTFAPIPGEKE